MKKSSLLLLMLVLVLALAACNNTNSPATNGGAVEGESANGEQVTIRMTMSDSEMSVDQIKEFESENPNIKILREDSDPSKLAAQLATNDAPDIIRVTGVSELPSYVIRGIAMDLTPMIESSKVIHQDDFLPAVNTFRFNGKVQGEGPLYGIPKDWSPDFTIFVNKKLFKAAGVPLPSTTEPMTWNQMFDLAKKLTIMKDGKIVQYGLGTIGKTEADLPSLMDYLLSKGVTLSSDDYSKIDFDKPEVKEALNLWVEAVKGNYGINTVNQDKAGWGGEVFLPEKAAMIQVGYWFTGALRSDKNASTHLDDFIMIPAPIAEGGKRVSPTGSATGAIINKNSTHPEEAWKVYEWFFGGKPAQDRAKSGWGVPAYKSLMSLLPQSEGFDKQTYTVLQEEIKNSGIFIENNPYLLNGSTLLQKQITPVYFGKATLDDAIAALNKDANKMIGEAMAATNGN